MKKPTKINTVTGSKQQTGNRQVIDTTHSARFNLYELLIILIEFCSFALSVFNQYALDDFIVLVKNKYVQTGFAGIGKIMGQDTFAGMTEGNIMVLAGGRYRPLSLVTFAIEHQLYGNKPLLSHLINVILYGLTGLLLFRLLKKLLINNEVFAFAVTALFIALPIHSEAVINIKGRDDILCFLFFVLSMGYLFDYSKQNQRKQIFISALCYFLSLLSKETAITFLAVFPLGLYFFTSASSIKIFRYVTPHLSVALFFLLLRSLATKDNSGTVSTDLFNNPFILMNNAERYATVLLTWLLYLKLTFLPVHLSYDYNYNQVPAVDFSDWRVLFSLALHIAAIVFAVIMLQRKSLYSFGILFYFITFSILSNLFFNIGAPLAERFMYIPSLGICIVLIKTALDTAPLLLKISSDRTLRYAGFSILGIVLIAGVSRNAIRCSDWKDNHTLFLADVNSVPQNAKANLNAGLAHIEISQVSDSIQKSFHIKKAKEFLQKGISIYPKFADGYLNMGVIYNWQGNYDSAEVWWNKARIINPGNSSLKAYDKVLSDYYFQQGLKKGTEKNYSGCIADLLHAYRYDSLNAELNYNLGGVYFTVNDFANAKFYWEKTLQINPSNQQALSGLQAANQRLNQN